MQCNDRESLIRDLARALGDRVRTDTRTLAACSTDFGRAIHRTPSAVVQPRDADDIAATLEIASRHGIEATARGTGHSVSGQSLTHGIVIRTRQTEGATSRILDGNRVEISSGRTWHEVERTLNAQGRRIGVLADYLGLSVGGTLSVGGYGIDSVSHGAQVDAVERVRVVRSDGQLVWCSATEHADLFEACLAGLGRAGVIERVVMRTELQQAWSGLTTYHHTNLQSMVASLAWLNEAVPGPDLFKALGSRGRFVSTYGIGAQTRREAERYAPVVPGQSPRRGWAVHNYRRWRSAGVQIWTARYPRSKHLWADYLLTYDALVAFTDNLVRLLSLHQQFARHLKAVFILAVRKQPGRAAFQLEATRHLDAPLAFGVGLYTMVPLHDQAAASEVNDCLSLCLDCALHSGGRPYLYGWHRLTAEQQRTTYPSVKEPLCLSAHRSDPPP